MTTLLYPDLEWQAVPAAEGGAADWLFTDGNLEVRLEGRAHGADWQGRISFRDRDGDSFSAQATASEGYEALRQCALTLAGHKGGSAGPRLLQALDQCPPTGGEGAAGAPPAQPIGVEFYTEDETIFRDYEICTQDLLLRLEETDAWRGNYRWVGFVSVPDATPDDPPPTSETTIYALSAEDAILKFLPVCDRDSLQQSGVSLSDLWVKWFEVSREIEPREVPADIEDWRERDASHGSY